MTLLEAVKNWLRSEKWAFDVAEEKPLLRLRYSGRSGGWECYAHAIEVEQVFVFYSVCVDTFPPGRRGAVTDYVARANAELSVGNFEVEEGSETVRFRTAVDVKGGALAANLIRNVCVGNVVTVDRYLQGLKAVVAGDDPARCLPQRES